MLAAIMIYQLLFIDMIDSANELFFKHIKARQIIDSRGDL